VSEQITFVKFELAALKQGLQHIKV
jgi:hypothetical protein